MEATFKEAGRRRFDVYLNDTKVLTDLDVYSEVGGVHRALVKVFRGLVPIRKATSTRVSPRVRAISPKSEG